jgi:hypothetical protein
VNPVASPEVQRLAHVLGVVPDRLAGLAGVPAGDVRLLHGQVVDFLFRADKAAFLRVAALSKSVPVAVAAKLAEAALPPLLAARAAELIDSTRAAELVGRLSSGYVADVAAAMEPSRAPDLIRQMPARHIANVAAELARRQEWVVIGGFVAQVSPEALAACIDEFDGERLLRVGYVLDGKDRLDEIAEMISDAQVDDVFAAAARLELWTELDDLVTHLRPERRSRMATRFGRVAPEVRAAFETAGADGVLAEPTLAVLRAAS